MLRLGIGIWILRLTCLSLRALAFLLMPMYFFIGLIGWGDIKFMELIFQMEDFNNMVGMVFKTEYLELADSASPSSPFCLSITSLLSTLILPFQI